VGQGVIKEVRNEGTEQQARNRRVEKGMGEKKTAETRASGREKQTGTETTVRGGKRRKTRQGGREGGREIKTRTTGDRTAKHRRAESDERSV
jgi:hypothetical protein